MDRRSRGRKPTDLHGVGCRATVRGSLGPIAWDGNPKVYGYFVEWDDMPGVNVFIVGTRVREEKAD